MINEKKFILICGAFQPEICKSNIKLNQTQLSDYYHIFQAIKVHLKYLNLLKINIRFIIWCASILVVLTLIQCSQLAESWFYTLANCFLMTWIKLVCLI